MDFPLLSVNSFGTRCIPCETGTFMNEPNGLTRCFSCFSCDPGSGLSIKQNCTSISDTVFCEPMEGFFCTDLKPGGCGAAQRHRSCEPGQFIRRTVCFVYQSVTLTAGSFTFLQFLLIMF
uniref:Tumor necrosis factor receptor superfamily member 14-like n=1 Tax=Cyprinodon variegatus TaxID=28743 RepID=A0A3Q2GDR1_CYPVA